MTEKQYSKKRLFEKITFKIPRTTDYSVKVVRVIADFILKSKSFDSNKRISEALNSWTNDVSIENETFNQTFTTKKKRSNSLISKLSRNRMNASKPFYLNHNYKLPYYSTKENASLLADNVFFNFLIIQQPAT